MIALTPSPEAAATITQGIVPWAQQNYGVALDRSPTSLRHVDGISDDRRTDGQFDKLQPLLFSMGCYVGEVFARHAKARWRNTVGKADERFRDGPQHDLASYCHVSPRCRRRSAYPRRPTPSRRRVTTR